MSDDLREIQPRLTISQANLIGEALQHLYDGKTTTPEQRSNITSAAGALAAAVLATAEDATERAEHVVTDPDELYELLARDLRNVDGFLMDLIGEDADVLFALTADWKGVTDRLPKLLAECGTERKRFPIHAGSVRWAVMRRRVDASGDVEDPDWVVTVCAEDGRPFNGQDEGSFQCVYVDEEWDL